MYLGSLMHACKFREESNYDEMIDKEVRIMQRYRFYESAEGERQFITSCFKISLLAACASQVADSLKYLEVFEEGDEDFLTLEMIGREEKIMINSSLDDVYRKYKGLLSVFDSVPMSCVQVLRTAKQYENVLSFFREYDFHSKQGIDRFHDLQENITMRINLRTDSFLSDLLIAVIICHDCIVPILERCSLRKVISKAKVCNCVWNEAKDALILVSANIKDVRSMFRKELMSAHDAVSTRASDLAHSGRLVLNASALNYEKFPFDLVSCFEVQRDLSQGQVLPEVRVCVRDFDTKENVVETLVVKAEDVLDFRSHLIFESSKQLPDDSRRNIEHCLEALLVVGELETTLRSLVRLAFPGVRYASLRCGFNSKEITHLQHQLEDERTSWQESIRSIKSSPSPAATIWKSFSTTDVARMICLLEPRELTADGISDSSDVVTAADNAKAIEHFMAYPHAVMSLLQVGEEQFENVRKRAFEVSRSTPAARQNREESIINVLEPLANDGSEIAVPSNCCQRACPFVGENIYGRGVLSFVLKMFLEAGQLPCFTQLLWCSSLTTLDVLESFYEKVVSNPGLTFACIGVDRLRLQLRQEVEQKQQIAGYGRLLYIYVDVNPSSSFLGALNICKDLSVSVEDLTRMLRSLSTCPVPNVVGVCGPPGCGKTKFIQTDLLETSSKVPVVTLAINCTVDYADFIRRLQAVSSRRAASIHIKVYELASSEELNKLLFHLLVCGALYDESSCQLFALSPDCRKQWRFVVEIPFQASSGEPFLPNLEQSIPVLSLFATKVKYIREDDPLNIEGYSAVARRVQELTQWPFKRKPAVSVFRRKRKSLSRKEILGLSKALDELQRTEFTEPKCTSLEVLLKEKRIHIRDKTKVTFFLKLLARRFQVFSDAVILEQCQSDWESLPWEVYSQFVDEAAFLCQEALPLHSSHCPVGFLNFNHEEGQGLSFYPLYFGETIPPRLHRLAPDGEKEVKALREVCKWEAHLGWMLNISRSAVNTKLRERRFILTEEICYKMYVLHQRKCARMNLIIEGETGVGKTYVVETYSSLLNSKAYTDRDSDRSLQLTTKVTTWFKDELLPLLPATAIHLTSPKKLEAQSLLSGLKHESFDAEELVSLWTGLAERIRCWNGEEGDVLYSDAVERMVSQIRVWYKEFPLLKPPPASVLRLLDKGTKMTVSESTSLLRLFVHTPRQSLFRKLLVHPSMSKAVVKRFLDDAIDLADKMNPWEVVVFFDEINTASCPGLFKEIVVDGTCEGDKLPENLFVVAAINPYTSRSADQCNEPVSTATYRAEYHVHPLSEVMKKRIWKYGGFRTQDMGPYIRAKMELEREILKDMFTYLKKDKEEELFANVLMKALEISYERNGAKSVSQRDIQRVFHTLPFIYEHGVQPNVRDRFQVSLCVAIALTFCWRLPEVCLERQEATRKNFYESMDFTLTSFEIKVQTAVDYFVNRKNFEIPKGVALTRGLKENVYAIVVCCQTNTPLGIVGAPGSSKSLSFAIAKNNLLGPQNSSKAFCRKFPAVDVFFHQCSETTLATDIEQTFAKAIRRQKQYDSSSLEKSDKTRCVVFMDEASLPKESSMALKALHPFLDEPKVAAVILSNRPFDAAKANRMITIHRSVMPERDLRTLCIECLGLNDTKLGNHEEGVVKGLSSSFMEVTTMEKFKRFFHYRDLIHVLRFIHRHRKKSNNGRLVPLRLNPSLLLRALEENMSGMTEMAFKELVGIFFSNISSFTDKQDFAAHDYDYRPTISVLMDMAKERLSDCEQIWTGHYLAPRFTMIIDPTDDYSVARLLTEYNVWGHGNCKTFRMSDFPNDLDDLHSFETLKSLRLAFEEEGTVVLVNCKRIEGNLYELLNQSYRGGRSSTRFASAYANIAIGGDIYPCKVHHGFQCVVVLRLKDIERTPAPYLSRFAKFLVTPQAFFQLKPHPTEDTRRNLAELWRCRTLKFIDLFGKEAFVGLDEHGTLDVLLLACLDVHDVPDLSDSQTIALPGSLATVLQTYARDESDRSAAFIISKLLHLASADSVVLNIRRATSRFGEMMAKLYFEIQEHFELQNILVEIMEKMESSGLENKSTRKLLLYSRTNRELLTLRHRPDCFLGDLSSNVAVTDLSELQSRKNTVDFLSAFILSETKTIALIVIDSVLGADVGLICQLIDDADQIACRSKTAQGRHLLGDRYITLDRPISCCKGFVLILHFPPERRYAAGLMSPRFLNGWDSFCVDIGEKVGRTILKIVSSVCAPVYAASDAAADRAYNTAVNSLFDSPSLLDSCIDYFCSRVRVLTVLDAHIPAGGKQFYRRDSPVSERRKFVAEVFSRHSALLKCLKQLFAAVCPLPALSKLLHRVALQVFRQLSFSSFPDLVFSHIADLAKKVFSRFLERLCRDFGLVTLMEIQKPEECQDDIALLLKLLQTDIGLQGSTTCESFYFISCRTLTVFKTPLFLNLSRRLHAIGESLVVAGSSVEIRQALLEAFKRDPVLCPLLHRSTESNWFTQSYGWDEVTLLCERGSKSRSNHSGIQLTYEYLFTDFSRAGGDILSYVATFVRQSGNNLRVLYDAIVAAQPVLEGFITAETVFQETTGKSYCDAVNRKICLRFQEAMQSIFKGSHSMQIRLWTSAFFRYCSSGAPCKFLYGSKNSSIRASLQMLTAMSTVAVYTEHPGSEDLLRHLWEKFMMPAGELVSGLRQTLRSLADTLTSSLCENVDKSMLFVQLLSSLIDILPETVDAESEQDIIGLFEVLNGRATAEVAELQVSQRFRNYLLVKLWGQLKCKPGMLLSWVERVIQGDSLLATEEFKSECRYRPVGYPSRQFAYTCLRQPLADSYFNYQYNKTRNRSRYGVELKETVTREKLASEDLPSLTDRSYVVTPALDSIEVAVQEWLTIDGMVDVARKAYEENVSKADDVLERKLLEFLFRDIGNPDNQSVERLNGTTLLFLERLIAEMGPRNAADFFANCSTPFLRDEIGASMSSVLGLENVSSAYMPSLDELLVLDDRVELLPGTRAAWKRFVSASSQCSPQDYSILTRFCNEWLSSHKPDRKRWQKVLKMFVVARCQRITAKGEEAGLASETNTEMMISGTAMLDWTREDKVVLEFVTSPLELMRKVSLPKDNNVVKCFSSSPTDEMHRHLSSICLNHLLLTVGLGKNVSYFWNLLFKPLEAVGKFCFGGSSEHVYSEIRGPVRFDCCHMYGCDGQPSYQPAHLSLEAAQTVTLLTFASLLLGVVFQSITAHRMCEKLLTRSLYVEQAMGETLTEKVVNFCWMRVTQMFHFMFTSLGHSTCERTGLVIQHVISRFAAEHANSSELLAEYANQEKRAAAEICFQSKVFQPVLDMLQATELQLQAGSSLYRQLREFRRQIPKVITRQEFFRSLVNAYPGPSSDSPVHTIGQYLPLLSMTHLLVPLGRLYQLIHFCFSGHIDSVSLDEPLDTVVKKYLNESCDDQERVEVDKTYEEGKKALETLLYAVAGHLHVNAGCGTAEFHAINEEVPFRYVVSTQDPDCHDTLFRAMEELVVAHNSVIDACKRYSGTTDNKHVASLLSMCDFEETGLADLADIVHSECAGIVCIPTSEFEALVSTCIIDRAGADTLHVDIQFDQLETLMIQQFVVGARRVSLEGSRKVFSLKRSSENTLDTRAVAVPPACAVPSDLLNPLDDQLRMKIREELSRRTYEGCMDLLEDLSDLISSFTVTVAGGADATGLKVMTVSEFAKGHKLRCQGLAASAVAGYLQMGSVYDIHDTCLKYLNEHNFLHVEIPQMLKAPLEWLGERDLCDELNRLSVVSPEDFIKSATDFQRIVHSNMVNIRDAVDRCLRKVLSEDNDVVECLPDSILVRHCAAVLLRVLKAASEARSVVFSRNQGQLLDLRQASSDDTDVEVHSWYDVCLPHRDLITYGLDSDKQRSHTQFFDLVVKHAFSQNLWKSWEWSRCSILEFNIESTSTSAIQPTPAMVIDCGTGECKLYVFHGINQEDFMCGDHKEVKNCRDSEQCLLASRYGLVLLDNEEPEPELEPISVLEAKHEEKVDAASSEQVLQDETEEAVVPDLVDYTTSVGTSVVTVHEDDLFMVGDGTYNRTRSASSFAEGDFLPGLENVGDDVDGQVAPEETEAESQVERVHLYKCAAGEVCRVRVRIPEAIKLEEDVSRITLTKEGVVFLADFVKSASVHTVTQAILSTCTRQEAGTQEYHAVLYTHYGEILPPTTALQDLERVDLENLVCSLECPETYHCFFKFSSTSDASVTSDLFVVPALIRDYVSEMLRNRCSNRAMSRSFYLWPPFSSASVQRVPKMAYVIPSNCVTRMTFQSSAGEGRNGGEGQCDLPVLLTSKLDNLCTYAAKLLSVDNRSNVLVSRGKPVSALMSVGCCLALGYEPQMILAGVPADWHVLVCCPKRDLDDTCEKKITVKASLAVKALLQHGELLGSPLPLGEKMLLDEETGCSLPPLFKIPIPYVANISEKSAARRLLLCLSSESVAVHVAVCHFSGKQIASTGTAAGVTLYLRPLTTGEFIETYTVRNFLKFFSWFPELSSAFSGNECPYLAFGDGPLWLTPDVNVSHQVARLKDNTHIRIGADCKISPSRKTIKFSFGDRCIAAFIEDGSKTVGSVMSAVRNLLKPGVAKLFPTIANGCIVEETLTMDDLYTMSESSDEIVLHLKTSRETFEVIDMPREQLKTVSCTVSVKGITGRRSIKMEETSRVEDIISSSLNEFQLSKVDACKCTLFVAGARVPQMDRTLSELMRKMPSRRGAALHFQVVLPI